MAESTTRYRDAVLSAPRSMTVGTHPVSTAQSVRTGGLVRTDSESARTVTTVKVDSRLAWTGQPVRASQEQHPATSVSGWSGPVVLASQSGSAGQSGSATQSGYASQSGSASRSGPASQSRPASQSGSGQTSSGRARISIGRAKPAWRMEPLMPSGPPTDPWVSLQTTSTR